MYVYMQNRGDTAVLNEQLACSRFCVLGTLASRVGLFFSPYPVNCRHNIICFLAFLIQLCNQSRKRGVWLCHVHLYCAREICGRFWISFERPAVWRKQNRTDCPVLRVSGIFIRNTFAVNGGGTRTRRFSLIDPKTLWRLCIYIYITLLSCTCFTISCSRTYQMIHTLRIYRG